MEIPPSLRYLATTRDDKALVRQWLSRHMSSNRSIVWQDMAKLGLRADLESLLRYEVDGQQYDPLLRLFSIDEDIYREPVIEFLLTFQLRRQMSSADKRKISFRYRGKTQKLSVADLGVYLGLYTRSQADSPWFRNSIRDISGLSDRHHRDIWAELAGTVFRSNVKSSTLIRPVHHILHKLLVCSVFGKKESGAVIAEELVFMDAVIHRRNINIASMIADRLLEETSMERPVFMGAIITRLLHGMGLLTDSDIEEYRVCARSQPFDLDYCKLVHLIEEDREKRVVWKNTKQIIPGLVLTKKRGRGSTPAAEVGTSQAAEHIVDDTEVRHAGAEIPGPPSQAIVRETDPVTPLTQYYILDALEKDRRHRLLISRHLGLPDPEPYLYRCGPPQSTSPSPSTIPPQTTQPPPTRTTPVREEIHSVETRAPAARPATSAPAAFRHAAPEGLEGFDYVYLSTDSIIFDDHGMILRLGPLASGDVPSESLLRLSYLKMLEELKISQETLLQWGIVDPLKMTATALRDILVQHKLLTIDGQRVSSGQQSVVGPSQPADIPDQGSPAT